MADFQQLATSRQQWIQEVLVPWCREAPLKDLQQAEREWVDIAGKVDPQRTLWMWAWARFPALVDDELRGFDETYPITLTLRDGTQRTGYPEARKSEGGRLLLAGINGELGPFSLDQIVSAERADFEASGN